MTPIAPPKWLPYVDIGGGAGSGFAIGRATAFVPFWQDIDSLMFVRFGADTGRRKTDGDFNIGLGYRTKIDSEWILGAFAGFDSSQTDFNHTFNQFSFGLEAMSADWDVRANAYLAKKTNRPIADKFELAIKDTTIAIIQAQEAALSGFDGEVGYRVFSTDNTDVRVFAGGYTFHHADVNTSGVGASFSVPYRDLTGPKLRAELNIFDLDMLGPQSRLSVEGQISHDNVYHTSEYIGATLRIPLGDVSGSGAQALDELDRRMADPVRRNDNVLTQWQFNKPEPVVIYNGSVTSKPTNTLYYAEQRSGAGAATYADPTTIQDAAARGGSGKNAFIVLTDAGGSTIDATGTTIQSGETVAGAGVFKVRGANGDTPVFTHAFAPGSGAVALTATTGNVLNIDGDANLANFSIVAPFVDAIYGANVGNVSIYNINIDGGGTGTNGIVFKQTDTSGTSNISIGNTSITGVTNDGVDLTVSATAGLTSTTNLTTDHLTVDAGHDGLSLTSASSGGSNATVYAGIHDSTIAGGSTGLNQVATTAGGTLTQTVVVDPTTVSGGDFGIYISGKTAGGTLTQNFTDIDGAISGGFSVYAKAHGGALTQYVEAANLTVPASHTPLSISAYADAGSIVQSVGITNVTANGSAGNDIEIYASAHKSANIQQAVSLSHVKANNAAENGVYAYVSAEDGATALQSVGISNLTATGNGGSGVYAIATGTSPTSKAPSVVAQYVTIDGASLSNNSNDGVYAAAFADTNAVVRQDLNVLNATIENNNRGIEMNGYAYDGASTQQNIYFAYDAIQNNAADGVDLHVLADGKGAFAAQYGTIYNVDASYNGEDGFNIGARAVAADAEQQFYMVYVTGDHEGRDGLEIVSESAGYAAGSYTNYPAHVQQNIYAIYGSFSNNARHGVEIYNYAVDGAATDQSVFLYGLDLSHNTRSGVFEQSFAYDFSPGSTYTGADPTHLYSDVYVIGSVVDYNGRSGIDIAAYAFGQTVLEQHIKITASDVSHNAQDGLELYAYATGTNSLSLQYADISGSTFDHNGESGASVVSYQNYGYGPRGLAGQIVTIDGSDFSYNGEDGMFIGAFAYGVNGRAEQYFYISNSSFDHNTLSGIYDVRVAEHGTYLPGYTCLQPQYSYGGCAFVRQVVDISDSSLSHNGEYGIALTTYVGDYGLVYNSAGFAAYNPALLIQGSHIDYNGSDGVRIQNAQKYYNHTTLSFTYAGGLYQYIYIDGTSISHNADNGIRVINGVEQGAQFQNIVVGNGSTIEDNGAGGIYLITVGKYTSQMFNGLEVYDSSVSNNAAAGILDAHFVKYGEKSTQLFASSGSTVDGNGGGGLYMIGSAKYMYSAKQTITTDTTSFSDNGTAGTKYGLAASFDVYKSFAGGQYVTSTGDTISGNSGGGAAFYMHAEADHYAVINQSVTISGDLVDHNLGYGMLIDGRATDGTSGLQRTIYVSDSTFSNNAGAGLYDHSYASGTSTLFHTLYVYNASATTAAQDNSYEGILVKEFADYGGFIRSHNHVLGVDLTGNGTTGLRIDAKAGSNGTPYIYQYNFVYGGNISGNGTGIELYATGAGAGQYSHVGGNTIANNPTFGVYALAGGSATQYVQVFTLGNTFSGNGADVYFKDTGASSQTHD